MVQGTEQPARHGWSPLSLAREAVFGGNLYNRAELAGAFGDLGTFIAFVVGFISINKMDPAGILVAFGVFQLAVGLLYKTPFPVQPMKAIGGAAIANPAAFTHGAIWGAGLFTAIIWTLLGLTGAVTWLQRLTTKPVVRGIMLGLGLSFCLEGARQMAPDLLLAVPAAVLVLVLLNSRRLPAMLALLVVGVVVSLVREPSLAGDLGRMALHFRLPELPLAQLGWNDLVVGALILGLPQVPLTLGNAVIGTAAENNQLFPDRPLTVKTIALSHGVMNFASAAIGGVPMCHGAGGMAGHVRFGARTGGALVMLGILITFLGFFLADSVTVLFRAIPGAVLGVVLFFTGLELATSVRDIGDEKEDVYVMLVTAALAMVNMGVAFVAGLALYYALQRKLVRV